MSNIITKNIAFALAAVGCGCLEFSEFHMWIENLIANEQNLPTYIFDLYDAKSIAEADKAFFAGVGPYNSSGLSINELHTFWGIAALRGKNLKELEVPITEKTALKRMEQYPHVVHRFRELFPFVEF